MKNTLNSTWRTLEDLLFCILLESWKLPWIVTNCHDSSRTSLALFFTHSISRRLGFDSVSKFEGDEVDEEGRWGGCACDEEEHEGNEGAAIHLLAGHPGWSLASTNGSRTKRSLCLPTRGCWARSDSSNYTCRCWLVFAFFLRTFDTGQSMFVCVLEEICQKRWWKPS